MYEFGEEEIQEVSTLLRSKKLFRNQGENIETNSNIFESNLAQYLDVKHTLLVTTGTNALICALKSLNLKADDEVIVPTYTFFGTIAAIINAGAIPKFVDVDATLSLCPMDLANKITEKTKAIIAVHMNGNACNMAQILPIATQHNIYLIEDVAQSIGGSFNNQKLGTFGLFGCYSFNQDKIITAGEGGAIVTNNSEMYLKNLNIHDASCIFGSTFKHKFQQLPEEIGSSMRVSEITGALLNVQLKKLDNIIQKLNAHRHLLKDFLLKNKLNVILSHNEIGNCGTTLYIKFESIEDSISCLKTLNHNLCKAYPILSKPGHNPRQWINLLNNHFRQNKYHISQFINNWETMNSIIKIEIPYSEEEINRFKEIRF